MRFRTRYELPYLTVSVLRTRSFFFVIAFRAPPQDLLPYLPGVLHIVPSPILRVPSGPACMVSFKPVLALFRLKILPRGFVLQNIVYAYFLVFEKEKSSAPILPKP